MKIPDIYRTFGDVTGIPLNWQDEVTGVLPAAIKAYLNHRIDGTPFDEIHAETVRAFLDHYINAPCWNHMNEEPELALELADLRRDVRTLNNSEAIAKWIRRCLNLGIDPL